MKSLFALVLLLISTGWAQQPRTNTEAVKPVESPADVPADALR